VQSLVTVHAVLGPGGIGGLVGSALARSGHEVTFVVRPETASSYPRAVHVESTTMGTFDANVEVVATLEKPVDVLWVTLKNPQLDAALAQVDAALLEDALVIPLMNGIDHVMTLRDQFPRATVIAGSIRTESTRVAPGRFVHGGWHVGTPPTDVDPRFPLPTKPVQLAGAAEERERVEAVAVELEAAGVPAEVWQSEKYLLWSKLAVLCPYALATTAVAGSIGAVRADPTVLGLLEQCMLEVLDAAEADGVELDRARALTMLGVYPDDMRVSMERDAAAGRPIEIEAVTSPVIRVRQARGLPSPATTRLHALATQAVERRHVSEHSR
jgi:2-dehydropantoate 2-reductase